jgi:hypothetical protein
VANGISREFKTFSTEWSKMYYAISFFFCWLMQFSRRSSKLIDIRHCSKNRVCCPIRCQFQFDSLGGLDQVQQVALMVIDSAEGHCRDAEITPKRKRRQTLKPETPTNTKRWISAKTKTTTPKQKHQQGQ